MLLKYTLKGEKKKIKLHIDTKKFVNFLVIIRNLISHMKSVSLIKNPFDYLKLILLVGFFCGILNELNLCRKNSRIAQEFCFFRLKLKIN